MKKLYLLFFFLVTILQQQAKSQCGLLATPYNSDNSNKGVMFNIVTNTNPVTITSFDLNMIGFATGTFEIYYKAGTYIGSESNAAAWTLAGSATATSLGINNPTPLPLSLSISIPANTTFGFYITEINAASSAGVRYTNGTFTTIASNSDIAIEGGVGKSYPFGQNYNSRRVNCTPHYYVPGITLASPTDNMTWTGSVSTDWNIACNWTPYGVPTATNSVIIPNVTNDPVILNGTTAVAKEIYLNNSSILTINTGATLNVNTSSVPSSIIMQGTNATIINDGIINVGAGSGFGITASNTAIITNRGTINSNNASGIVSQSTASLSFNNAITGIVNSDFRSIGMLNLTNLGVINYSGTSYALNFSNTSELINEGTVNINSGAGIFNPTGAIISNSACGKMILNAGNYQNGGTTTNTGLLQISNELSNTGVFTNNSILKYTTLTGTITSNSASSVIVNNSPSPIFTYGGIYNGTIDGIYVDAAAVTPAGTFVSPNTFTASGTLPSSSQTLYAKIIPNGGSCSYVVPFSYLNCNITSTTVVTNVACNGGNTGAINLTPTG
ncbi:hypothetical protein, partial [Pedobacter glucosidilyticus]|uniref:hypothetical protein n=1 Tax=Pedobacter glucosidilyticus TaxID=1122941 RepID=UPI00055D5444